jgi:phage repressor protein C with HTH and peptisase S24 domain
MSAFSDSITNRRFTKVYETLKAEKKFKNKTEMAQRLGTYNHVVNLILKGERGVTLDQIGKLYEAFGIDANYLMGYSDTMYKSDATFVNGTTSIHRLNITLVPQKAMAGYAMNPGDWAFLDSLQKFSVPGLEGDLTAFEISGDSMLPTITNGDVVICEPIERGEPIRDNQVYVVVTDVVVAKRIQQLKQGAKVTKLRLISDNGEVYRPYDVDLEEVQQILRVKCRLTSHAIH